MSNFKLMGTDNVSLIVNDYLVENMKGIVICVHGMCEHSKRYENLALFLNKSGFSVYTYDHRGHGESCLVGEELGYLGKNSFNKMVYDLNIVVSYVKEKFPQEKIFILGHSMGSFITERFIQLFDKVDGIILSGSNYGTKSLRLGRIVSKLVCIFRGEKTKGKLLEKLSIGRFNKYFIPNRTSFDWLSRDEVVVDDYINDSKCGFTFSNRFYHDLIGGLIELSKSKNFKTINRNLPILIISGKKDPVSNNGEGVKALYQILSNNIDNVELKLYKDARHEIFNETNSSEVYQDVFNWLTTILK